LRNPHGTFWGALLGGDSLRASTDRSVHLSAARRSRGSPAAPWTVPAPRRRRLPRTTAGRRPAAPYPRRVLRQL